MVRRSAASFTALATFGSEWNKCNRLVLLLNGLAAPGVAANCAATRGFPFCDEIKHNVVDGLRVVDEVDELELTPIFQGVYSTYADDSCHKIALAATCS
eukprot:1148198-Pyramimonas_sp.AAC.1